MTTQKRITATERCFVAYVKTLPCDWCGKYGVEAHHQGAHALGKKGSSLRLNALCRNCHRRYHDTGKMGEMWGETARFFLMEKALEHLIAFVEREEE